IDLYDVGAGFEHLLRNERQRSWLVLHCDPQPSDAALPNQIADEDVREQVRVDIAAAQDGRVLLARVSPRVGDDGRETGRAGAFDVRFLNADEHRNRSLQVELGDENDVVEQSFQDLRCEIARVLDPGTFSQRVATGWPLVAIDGTLHS